MQPEIRYVYAFEEIADDLPRPPMAALRALHVSGIQISPRGWVELPLEIRRALCVEGTRDQVSNTTVRALMREARLEHIRLVQRLDDAAAGVAPQAVSGAGGPLGPRMAELWPSLRPLDRFMLRAYAINARLFERAAHEILGHIVPGGAPWRGELGRAEVYLSPAAIERVCSSVFLGGNAFLLARTAGVRAARATPELFDLAGQQAIGLIELDWRVLRTPHTSVLWQAHASTWEGAFSSLASMAAATTAAVALRDMIRDIDPEASLASATVKEEMWEVGSGLFSDDPTVLMGM